MANRYANLVGSNKIKDEYQKINTGFDKVQQEMDEKPDNSFARINDVEAEGEDAVTIEAGTGITVTTTPEEKKIRITATGEATPGPHGSEHNHDGADPIPDLVQLMDDLNAHLDNIVQTTEVNSATKYPSAAVTYGLQQEINQIENMLGHIELFAESAGSTTGLQVTLSGGGIYLLLGVSTSSHGNMYIGFVTVTNNSASVHEFFKGTQVEVTTDGREITCFNTGGFSTRWAVYRLIGYSD